MRLVRAQVIAGRRALPRSACASARASVPPTGALLASAEACRGALRTVSTAAPPQTENSPRAETQSSVAPALGTDLRPADMLALFNDPSFCAYRSTSHPTATLLGNDEVLASTALTHESWMHGLHGHNRRLAFMGMRALCLVTDRQAAAR